MPVPKGQRKKTRVSAKARRVLVLDLKASGLSERAIVDELAKKHNIHISNAQVHRDWRGELAEIHALNVEEAQHIVRLEMERLEKLLAKVWTQAMKGSLPHIASALKIMAQMRDILGLKKPELLLYQSSEQEIIVETEELEYDLSGATNEQLANIIQITEYLREFGRTRSLGTGGQEVAGNP